MVRRYVEGHCLGRTIVKAKVLDASILDQVSSRRFVGFVRGKRINAVIRHGKQLFFDMSVGFVTVHLGMTGDLIALEDEILPRHTRVLLLLNDSEMLVYDDPRKFGSIGLAKSVPDFLLEHRLGPDALDISRKEFVERVRRSRRAIKSVLIDQHVVAGVGNLYADESLFQARVHPLAPADQLSIHELERLWQKTRDVLKTSIDASTDFSKLPDGYLLRSRSSGMRCPRGNGTLQSIKVGGRTTIFCPVCQPMR